MPSDDKRDKHKQSLYLPEEMVDEIVAEAARQDRSLSWIVQRAWRLAQPAIASLPGRSDQASAGEQAG